MEIASRTNAPWDARSSRASATSTTPRTSLLLAALLLTIPLHGQAADPTSFPVGHDTRDIDADPVPVPVNPLLNGDFELYADTTDTGGGLDQTLFWTSGSIDPTCCAGYRSNAWFGDHDDGGLGDREAVVEANTSAPNHNFWQSTVTGGQMISGDFDAFAWTIEHGTIAPSANNQLGFSLSPLYAQHPYVGIFWEGAITFRADDMVPDADGRVRMDPIKDGEITCPGGYQPCLDFKTEYDGAGAFGDEDAQRDLLGKLRLVQISFWNFNRQAAGSIVVDNVAIEGATLPN